MGQRTPGLVYERYSTFEEALAEIRDVTAWYETVGALGFGVRAWY